MENEKSVRHYNIPIFIPQMGCPFQCIFCNQNKIASITKLPEIADISAIIDSHLKTISQSPGHTQIAFFGGSFTGLPISVQQNYLQLVQNYTHQGQVHSIRLSTRPDFINAEILEMLKKYHVTDIELGAQSLNEEVLRLSGRGHTVDDVLEASHLIKSYGFSLGLQMMVGLPGDTKERAIATAKKIIEAGADHTRIYPALVIKDTRLEKWFNQNKYKPLDLDESLDWVVEIMQIFEEAGLKILRIGLHPSEGLMNGDSLIAGPFHVSYRELVLTRLWHQLLKSKIKKSGERIDVFVPSCQINYAVGFKGQNKEYLKNSFKYVKFTVDKMLKNRELYISYC